MHLDGGHSTTDSDAEMDVLVAQSCRREQAHRFSDHQAELLAHATWAQELDEEVRRARLRRIWMTPSEAHEDQRALEQRELNAQQAPEMDDAVRRAQWRRMIAEHQALIEEGEAGPPEWSEPPESSE